MKADVRALIVRRAIELVSEERAKEILLQSNVLSAFGNDLQNIKECRTSVSQNIRDRFYSMLGELGIEARKLGQSQELLRLKIFEHAFEYVELHNNHGHGSTLEINYYALLDPSEIATGLWFDDETLEEEEQLQEIEDLASNETLFGASGPSETLGDESTELVELDWRKHGVLSPVRNQGSCGSCWSFASTEAVESKMAISHNYLFSLSPQQLVSCYKHSTYNCIGGSFALALQSYTAPFVSSAALPYHAESAAQKTCPSTESLAAHGIVKISGGAKTLIRPSNAQLRKAVRGQPVAVAIKSSERCFQFYKRGVLDPSKCGDASTSPFSFLSPNKSPGGKPDHAVLLVGYKNFNSKEDPEGVWIVRNSWGHKWGEGGNVYIKATPNAFLINTIAAWPKQVEWSDACHGINQAACQSLGKPVASNEWLEPSGGDRGAPLPHPVVAALAGAGLVLFIIVVLHIFREICRCLLCCGSDSALSKQRESYRHEHRDESDAVYYSLE